MSATVATPTSTMAHSEPRPSKLEAVHLAAESKEDDYSGDHNLEKGQELAPDGNDFKRQTSEVHYPPTRQVIFIMVSIVLAVLLVTLDRTIIATAIPQMTDDFHSINDIGWYGSAFMLTSCCFQLLLGRIYTFYPPKYVFLTVIGIFEIGSAICGAAPNSTAFIFGRAIAGIGAAGIMNGGIILMIHTVPLAKRPQYQGLIGATFGLSSVTGPLLGGAFTTNVSWRWCFYINLPIGAVAMAIIVFILKPGEPMKKGLSLSQQLTQLDLLGNLFLLPSIVCLLLALQWGGATYAWSDGRIIALMVLFGVLMVAFAAVQYFRQASATIPASIITNRSVVAAVCFAFCLGSSMIIVVFYTPMWFQAIKGVSAVQSGIDTIPLVLSLVVASLSAGQVVSRLGYYTPMAIASGIVLTIGAGLISTWNTESGHAIWIGFEVLYGFGLGLGVQQANMAAQTVLARKDVPTGVSLVFLGQTLGSAVFVSVGQNVFQSNLIRGLSGVVHDLNPARIVDMGATQLRDIVPANDLPGVLAVYNNALRQTFHVATGLAGMALFAACVLEWKSVKGKQAPSTPAQQSSAGKSKA